MAGSKGYLFQFPETTPLSSGVVLPGALAYFYQTGTTTDQAVYTTSALATAHDQPVVADSGGQFAPIYLDDAAAVDYRVTLRDSDSNLIYTQDDVARYRETFLTGTQTMNYTGFSADPSATTLTYFRFDRLVMLVIPLGIGNSDAITFSMSGIPNGIRPATAQYVHFPYATDNGGHLVGGAVGRINTDGSIDFAPADGPFSTNGWTDSSSKSIETMGECWYRLDDA